MQHLFLEKEELRSLTGRAFKSLQIAWLRSSGIPFRVNATGHPVVTRAAVEGRIEPEAPRAVWVPKVIGGR